MTPALTLQPGRRQGAVAVPPSKSHLHRLMIADFLTEWQGAQLSIRLPQKPLPEDIAATKECLSALRQESAPVLRCRESGSTLRFLLPVAMACRRRAIFTAEGGLPARPIAPLLEIVGAHGVHIISRAFPLQLEGALQPGVYPVPGNISSQIISGLLFALPILPSESTIHLTSPMESRGYVAMTLQVLRSFQIEISETPDGFFIPGRQRYISPGALHPEADWSSAAAWIAMNHLGSRIQLPPLPAMSMQPDRALQSLLGHIGETMDVSDTPDLFPVLAVAAGAAPARTLFTGVRRLRFKESDRLNAMTALLGTLGVTTECTGDTFSVQGIHGTPFRGSTIIDPQHDHRIAMAAAVAATMADGPVTILDPDCVRKSYPDFFRQFQELVLNP